MTRFAPGDLVVDHDAEEAERGTAVVVAPLDVAADEYHVDSLDGTVASVNRKYPADDPVVEVIFNGHLDSHVPNWRDILADARATDSVTFAELLDEYRDAWGVQLRRYAYPSQRLGARPYCPACRCRAEYNLLRDRWHCPRDDDHTIAREYADPLNADDEQPRPADEWDPVEPSVEPDGEEESGA